MNDSMFQSSRFQAPNSRIQDAGFGSLNLEYADSVAWNGGGKVVSKVKVLQIKPVACIVNLIALRINRSACRAVRFHCDAKSRPGPPTIECLRKPLQTEAGGESPGPVNLV